MVVGFIFELVLARGTCTFEGSYETDLQQFFIYYFTALFLWKLYITSTIIMVSGTCFGNVVSTTI
jgi:hypothetical protein